MFIDSVKIYIKAGSGGRGCSSLYRDKYARRGVPDGGDGGKGADVVIKADKGLYTLLDLKYNKHFSGANGGSGSGQNKRGKNASELIIPLPCGTVVKEIKTGCVLRDLFADGESFVVARGGAGGRGNKHFPEATAGEPGEEKELLLDFKLIADAGLAGFPNAGKSTLICAISNARTQIAAYPFTTKFPILGVVGGGQDAFVIADIPGLIEGSSSGRGLGDKFLRHIERTKVIVHIIDMAGCDGRDPLADYAVINKELKNYSSQVYRKPQIIVANKMDLEAAALNLKRFKRKVKKKVYSVSALKKEGLDGVIEAIREKL